MMPDGNNKEITKGCYTHEFFYKTLTRIRLLPENVLAAITDEQVYENDPGLGLSKVNK